MKAAFNILPVRSEHERLHLLVEAGNYGISFMWYTKSPTDIKGLAVFHFPPLLTPTEIAEAIKNVMDSNLVLREWNASTTICYDFTESLLVPETFQKPGTAADMLNLVFDTDAGYETKTDHVKGTAIHNNYAVHKSIASILAEKFPAADYFHSSSLQLENIKPASQVMYCILFPQSFKLFLFKEESLQLVQQFSYTKPVDVAYHLLNCCEQHGITATEVTLQLSGMIEAQSSLYNELYKYFLSIEFEHPYASISIHERIKFYPEHFFSHLTALVSCVS